MAVPEVRSDDGSSTVMALGLIAVLLTVTAAAVVVLGAMRAAHVARSSADLAALAGAVAYQRDPASSAACAEVERISRRHDVEMIACDVSAGGVVTVTTAAPIPLRLAGIGPEQAEGRARAGPETDGRR